MGPPSPDNLFVGKLSPKTSRISRGFFVESRGFFLESRGFFVEGCEAYGIRRCTHSEQVVHPSYRGEKRRSQQMLSAQFFVGYTVSQLPAAGDELCLSAPVVWAGGEMVGGFNTCFDPTTSELYAWCGILRGMYMSLPTWADSFLADPIPGSRAWEMLGFFPALILAKLEELKDMVEEEIEEDGEETLEGYFGCRLLEEISILEEYFQLATGEITTLLV